MLLNKNTITSLQREKAKSSLSLIEKKIIEGKISSPQQLLTQINNAWTDLFKDPLNTTVEVPYFRTGELPMRVMVEDPLFSAADDIYTLWDQWTQLREKLKDMFNLQASEISGLYDLIGQVTNKSSRFQLFTSDSDTNFLWSSDTFTSLEKINQTETSAFIDTSIGIVTLKTNSLNSINNFIDSLSIDKQSCVGIPGNNLVISSNSGSTNPEVNPEPQPVLEGITDAHSNFVYMFDGQPTTWLEWEYNYIPRKQKLQKVGVARVYDPGGVESDVETVTKDEGWNKYINWPGEDQWDRGPGGAGYPIASFDDRKNAKLIFTIKLNSPQDLSTIKVVPNIIGGVYPIIRSLLVSADGQLWREVTKDVYLSIKLNENLNSSRAGVPEANYTGIGLWNIEERGVQFIKFSLEAGGFYSPNKGFGHQFYFKITQEESVRKYGLWTSVDKWIQETRLPNPESGLITGAPAGTKINGQVVGAALGAAIGSVIPGVGTAIGAVVGSLIGSIGSYSHSSNTIREGNAYDIFTGERSVIAIKDIDLSIREYEEQSQVISNAHVFESPISALSIISTEDIPKQWDSSTEWIQYFVSSDGSVWTHIVPQNRSKGTEDTIYFDKVTSVFVKIILQRPSDKTKESPTLRHYAIKALKA